MQDKQRKRNNKLKWGEKFNKKGKQSSNNSKASSFDI